ncbi:Acetate--CoA ligase [ADP-forming] I [uncultured archaeon]|nr:Acetate--CoA ligase [ADP-forming] I [uncultured archaeon]
MPNKSSANLELLFNPKSVAVIGASNTPGKVGYAIVRNLIEANFSGEIHPVNLNEPMIQGINAFPSVTKIPGTVDAAIICVPSKFVPGVIKECAQKQIKAAVIITAGFSETGEEGKALEEEIRKIVEAKEMAVVGPNTLGIINTENGLNASFAANFPQSGGVAVVSQSGALCTAILDWARLEKIGFSKFISAGNKSFLGEAEYFHYLEKDPSTKSVLVYMESVKNAHKFLKEAAQLAKKKPVVVIKSGRSAEGQKAASSHTGAMSVDDKIFSIACKKSNMIRINSIEGFFDIAKILAKVKKTKGLRLAVVTNAGGPGVIVADSASVHKFTLPNFSAKTLKTVKQINPHASNPLDLIGDAKPINYRTALSVLQDDKEIDLIYALLTPQSMTQPERVADMVVSLNGKKPIICSFLGGTSVAHARKYLKENGVAEFETPERGIKALSRLQRYYENKKLKKCFEQKVAPKKSIKNILAKKASLTLEESFVLLKEFGIKTPKTIFFSKKDEIELDKVKFPVALKTASGLAHKTEHGLVKANINSKEELEKQIDYMLAKSKEISLKPVLAMQEMIIGQEVLLSAITTEFGKAITYGLGGIFVEIMKDFSQKLSPLCESDVEEMLSEVKGTAVLLGARTKRKYDVDALKRTIKLIASLANTYPQLSELEINPLIVTEDGCYAVDVVTTLIQKQKKKPKTGKKKK